ncbi:8759_t:CDS:2, partial [Funneliformis mosseae]
AVPIYATTSFTFKSSEHAANVFNGKEAAYSYTRVALPRLGVKFIDDDDGFISIGGYLFQHKHGAEISGISRKNLFGYDSFIVKAFAEILRDVGPCQNPFGTFLLLQGVTKEMMRVSVGYEHIDDIENAFAKIREI